MSDARLNIESLVDLLVEEVQTSRREAEEFFKAFFAALESALLDGETVTIKNFGTFQVVHHGPHKILNFQTRREFVIPRRCKVIFTPDEILRDLVNKPFSYLEPVELDVEDKDEKFVSEEPPLEPLSIFGEQATEIKSLLEEIKNLSPSSSSLQNEAVENVPMKEKKESSEQEKEEENISEEIIEEKNEEILVSYNNEEQEEIVSPPSIIRSKNKKDNFDESYKNENLEPLGIPSRPFKGDNLSDIPLPRKRRHFWLPLVLFIIIAGGVSLYYFYSPVNEYINTLLKIKTDKNLVSSGNKNFIIEQPFVTKDSLGEVSKQSANEVDSLQILFDTPRYYSEFITTEKIMEGSRLAGLSRRYYGVPVFWVYIYEANRDRITHPDNIPVGTPIRVPKLDSRLIDTSNPRCLEKAKELEKLYLGGE